MRRRGRARRPCPVFLKLDAQPSEVGRHLPSGCLPERLALERPTSERSTHDAACHRSLDRPSSYRSAHDATSHRALDCPASHRSLDRPASHRSLDRTANHRSLDRRPSNPSLIGHEIALRQSFEQGSLLFPLSAQVRLFQRLPQTRRLMADRRSRPAGI